MTININFFLSKKCKEINADEYQEYWELYKNYDCFDDPHLSTLLAALHKRLNNLFRFMFDKKRSNGWYNANESRELMHVLDVIDSIRLVLKKSNILFTITNEVYDKLIIQCKKFLHSSGGSTIPDDLEIFPLVDYEPIFEVSFGDIVQIEKDIKVERKVIGEGSYAVVSMYTDPKYGKKFVIKKAKAGLDSKELQRFKNEYEYLQKLHSPYFVEVYLFDENKNEYVMEYGGKTLAEYIDKNNSELDELCRKKIVWQIFDALEYLHSKGLLHRDISLTNVLIQKYDDCVVVKICDLGLVKEQYSDLTTVASEIKGSLNDSNLQFRGFNTYDIKDEIFALTRLVYYIMTGRRNMTDISGKHKLFVNKGISSERDKRYGNIDEMRNTFNQVE